MKSVIERIGYRIEEGTIAYEERLSSYEAADTLAGRRLDRRKRYAIIDGTVHEIASWSQACSGCYAGYDAFYSSGHGCSECGHTGRRVQSYWVPIDPECGDKD